MDEVRLWAPVILGLAALVVSLWNVQRAAAKDSEAAREALLAPARKEIAKVADELVDLRADFQHHIREYDQGKGRSIERDELTRETDKLWAEMATHGKSLAAIREMVAAIRASRPGSRGRNEESGT